MKIIAPSFAIALFCLGAHCSFSQMEVDKSISLTGGAGNSTIGGLVDAPTLGTDATNKDYVDAAVSAGGGGSLP
ncbi:MAG: hypothetical protein IT223_01230, partial [Crocinitomicaceae bacterium]|nr:hypothetical protein [Crocinitomicaceae bacterium]